MRINDRLRILRETEELSQEEFANKIKAKQQSVCRYERSGAKVPHTYLDLILRFFPDKFMWVFTGENIGFEKGSCQECEKKDAVISTLKETQDQLIKELASYKKGMHK